jgi:hypothetical protein
MHRLPGDRVSIDVDDDIRERCPRSSKARGRRLDGKRARRKAFKLTVRVVERNGDRQRKARPRRPDLEDGADGSGGSSLPAKLDRDVQISAERAGRNGDGDARSADRATRRPDIRVDEISRWAGSGNGGPSRVRLDDWRRRCSRWRRRRDDAVGYLAWVGAVVDAVHVASADAARDAEDVAVGVI